MKESTTINPVPWNGWPYYWPWTSTPTTYWNVLTGMRQVGQVWWTEPVTQQTGPAHAQGEVV